MSIFTSKKKTKGSASALKASTVYAICGSLQKCIGFVMMPIFISLLTIEQQGQYTIYTSWTGILAIILTLNLSYGSFSLAMVKFEDDRDSYISSIQGICLLLSTIFLVIYLPFQNLWNRLFELPTYVMLFCLLDILTLTAIQLWSGKKRFEFKYLEVVIVTLLIAILSPISGVLAVLNSEERGYARIIGFAMVSVAVGAVIFVVNCIKGKKLYNKKYWKFALGFNIPLLAYYLSQVIFNQSDRIMISHILGKSEAALYGVAYSLAMILTFILNAINNAYIPWLYNKIKSKNERDNKNVATAIAILIALMILVVVWFAPELIRLISSEEYLAGVYVVTPVAMSLLLLFYSQLFINVEFYYESKFTLVLASISSAVVNIVLNWILIPKFGIVAAGYTTLFSYLLFVIGNYIAMKYLLKKKQLPDELYNYKWLILVFIGFTIMSIIGTALYDHLFVRILITAIAFVIFIIFSKRLISIVNGIRKVEKE